MQKYFSNISHLYRIVWNEVLLAGRIREEEVSGVKLLKPSFTLSASTHFLRFNSIRTLAITLLGVLMLTACLHDDVAPAQERNVTVQMSVGTRAVTETDGTPTADEAKIYSLRVYAFVAGKLAGHYYTDASNLTAPHNFFMHLKMFSTTMQNVDFYVIANEKAVFSENSLSENTPESTLKSYKYGLGRNTLEYGLPMYDRKTIELDVSDNGGAPNQDPAHKDHTLLKEKPSFELKRPMAKLAVFAAKAYMSGDNSRLEVTGIRVTQGRRKENYLFPQLLSDGETTNYAKLKDIQNFTGTEATRTLGVTPLSEIDADKIQKALVTGITAGTGDVSEYAPVQAAPYYPSETPWGAETWTSGNTTDQDQCYKLEVDYRFVDGTEVGETHTGEVYLPRLKRNHYYMVCCTMHNTGMITVEYKVAPWNVADKYTATFEPPTYDLPLTPWGYTAGASNAGDYLTTDEKFKMPKIYKSEDGMSGGTYSFKFKVTAPSNFRWTPIIYEGGDNYVITVLFKRDGINDDVTVGKDDTDAFGVSSEPYEIRIGTKLNPNEINDEITEREIRFGISYTPSWTTTSDLLFISGTDENNIKWENSTQTQTIKIKHVMDSAGS